MENVAPSVSMVQIRVKRRNGKTIISNDQGDKWECLGNMPEMYSIAALVSFTLNNRVKWVAAVADCFDITMNIKILDK